MKLTVHAAIFSAIFAGFVAGAVTTKPAPPANGNHGLVISQAMPVPNCPPDTGCSLKSE